MGTEPLVGLAGGRGCTKSRSRRHTHNDFTQLRAAWMRKTLLLLVWLIRVLALERKKLPQVGAGRRRGSTGCPSSGLDPFYPFVPLPYVRMGLVLYAKGFST